MNQVVASWFVLLDFRPICKSLNYLVIIMQPRIQGGVSCSSAFAGRGHSHGKLRGLEIFHGVKPTTQCLFWSLVYYGNAHVRNVPVVFQNRRTRLNECRTSLSTPKTKAIVVLGLYIYPFWVDALTCVLTTSQALSYHSRRWIRSAGTRYHLWTFQLFQSDPSTQKQYCTSCS